MTQEHLETMYEEGCRLFFRRTGHDDAKTRAEEVFSDLLRLDPDHHRSHNMLGLCREYRGDHAAARESFSKAAELFPRSVYNLNLGISLANEERWLEALEPLENAVRLEPLDPGISFNLGLVQYALGRHAEAASTWRRTMEMNPAHEGIHLHLALALLEQGRLTEVEEILMLGVTRHPDSDELHRALAGVLEATGRPGAAAELWDGYLGRKHPAAAQRLAGIREERDRLRALAVGAAGPARPPARGRTVSPRDAARPRRRPGKKAE
jgi:tetratricopeptide (TPR) repeat protein